MTIGEHMPFAKRRIDVGGMSMATIDHGHGDPIVFLHGNPTSSFLWRNVIPHVEHLGRCIAPDLIGFGDSDKLSDSGPGSYRFVETRKYLDRLFEELKLEKKVTLVVHDWGSGLGFDWAMRNQDAVAGIAYMEANVAPRSWSQLAPESRAFFERLRTSQGEQMTLQDNVFIEKGLVSGVIRELTAHEMAAYRQPFLRVGEDRRPTLTWPNEIPFDGEPADVHQIVVAYSTWLSSTPIPKLLVNVSDGDTLTGDLLNFARSFPNQTEVAVNGRHFVQEDSPHEIGSALAEWIPTLERSGSGTVDEK